MPVYIYQNPKTRQIKEIVQSIHDKHEYSENGILWDRIFTCPQVNAQEKLSVNSNEKDFARVTKNQKGTVGDLWERSQELSEKRKKVYGKDPVKKKYFDDWSKKRKGKVHPKSHLD
jgi:predicted nucleic acid-binding Zn ribbon protein